MIKTLNPYNNTEKTAEIMSRYRPIAPKPEVPCSFPASDHSQKIRQSTFLRNVWPQLQARPTRTRKRGRAAPPISTPAGFKRSRTAPAPISCQQNLSLQGFTTTTNASTPLVPHQLTFGSLDCGFESDAAANHDLVTLPLLPSLSSSVSEQTSFGSEINFIKSFDEEDRGVEMNSNVSEIEIPEEKDFLQQLQGPVVSSCNVITPHPIRPVGSTIRVGCINRDQTMSLNIVAQAPKKPEEVEKEVESDVLPAVISDSNNRVRMANSAYKEMVGQPECPWLDSMVTGDERLRGRRIGGEVMLHLSDAAAVPSSSNGFSCWVRIEWGSNDGKKNSITTFCDVIKLSCVSRDYLFTWRFHTQTRSPSKSICTINV